VQFAITMCLKCREEVTNPFAQVCLIDDDSRIDFELFLFITNIKKEICSVLDSFLHFKKIFETKKSHNMLCLILDPRLKTFPVIFSFMGHEEGVNIVEINDRRSLYPMFLKCYHYLHPMEKSKVGSVDQTTNGDFDPDIFEQTSSTSELTLELIGRETLIFKCYQVDSKEIKCLLQRWTKYKTMFPTIFFGPPNLKDCWVTN
jgi:hypothetical protein